MRCLLFVASLGGGLARSVDPRHDAAQGILIVRTVRHYRAQLSRRVAGIVLAEARQVLHGRHVHPVGHLGKGQVAGQQPQQLGSVLLAEPLAGRDAELALENGQEGVVGVATCGGQRLGLMTWGVALEHLVAEAGIRFAQHRRQQGGQLTGRQRGA